MLSCKEVSLLLSKSCDQTLSWQQRLAVQLHLLYCRGCARFGKQLRFLRAAGRHLALSNTLQSGVKLSEAARNRILAVLQGD